ELLICTVEECCELSRLYPELHCTPGRAAALLDANLTKSVIHRSQNPGRKTTEDTLPIIPLQIRPDLGREVSRFSALAYYCGPIECRTRDRRLIAPLALKLL